MIVSAPRLHVIPAAGCDTALILRRGPTGHVAKLLWDRASDEFELGQWFKGRLYEHRADLSPDGRHMIYFAGTGTRWWTAVSRAPWLTALMFAPQDHTWHGGGAFASDGSVWLNGGNAAASKLPERLKPASVDALPHSTDGFHMGDMYATALTLRGWTHDRGAAYDAVLYKPLHSGWLIEQTFVTGQHHRSSVSPAYSLIHPERRASLPFPDWEWADPFDEKVQFAAQGALKEAQVLRDGAMKDLRVIRDFSDMIFEPRRAPYEGIYLEEAHP